MFSTIKTLSRMAQTTTLLYVLITIFLLTETPSASATNNTNYSQSSPKDSSLVAGITVTVSQSGLQYAKSAVLNSLLSEITPFLFPDVKTHVNSPIGRIEVQLSNVELSRANVSDSDLDLGKTGVTVFVGHVEMGMRFHWAYQYSAAYVPFLVMDRGLADVKVSRMRAGLTFTLVAHNGTLRLTVVHCETYIDDLEIELEGGASWLYQLFVHTFKYEIRAIMEVMMMEKISASANCLDNYLQTLPRFFPIDGVSTMDVTIVQDPLVSPSFLSVGVRGEFNSLGEPPSNFLFPNSKMQLGLLCRNSTKMVTIALCNYVVNSAATVYYEAGFLKCLVDKLPQEAWLNTHFWRWLIPQLYKKYPNMDMSLDFTCSKAPSIQLQKDGITTNVVAEVILLVKSNGQLQPIACISLALSMDASVNVVGNNITAKAVLDELSLELIWSNVGRFPIIFLQPIFRTIISREILPILNKKLAKGLPLPLLPSMELENANIQHEEGFIFVCSDVYYKGGIIKNLQLPLAIQR